MFIADLTKTPFKKLNFIGPKMKLGYDEPDGSFVIML